MKKLTFLSNLWSLLVGAQSSDVRVTSYGASDEHPMSIRLVSDETPWRHAGNLWRICAVLALLLTVGVGDAWAANWTKVSDLSAISNGDSVLVVIQDGKDLTKGKAFTTSGNTTANSADVTITSNSYISNPANTIKWAMTKSETTYTFKKGSNYITTGSSTNANVNAGTTSSSWYISKLSDGYFKVQLSSSSGRYLCWKGSCFGKYSDNFTNQITLATKVNLAQYHGAISFYKKASTSPTITKSSSFTTFTYSGGSPVSQSFTVGGTNLKGDVTVYAPTGYEVCKTAAGTYTSSVSYTPSAGTLSNQTVYIRLQEGQSAGNIASRNISITSTDATTQTIAISGSIPYTITWMANGNVHATTYVAVGSTLTLPGSNPTPSDCGCSGKAFYGWYGAGSSYSNASVAPTIAKAGDAVSADKTYYAVFADEEDGSSTSTLTASAQGWSDGNNATTKTISTVTYTWAQNSGSSAPKYYATGTAVRLYPQTSGTNGCQVTISSANTITGVAFTYVTDYEFLTNAPSVGTLTAAGVWSGSATSITFKNKNNAQVRIQSIVVTYSATIYSNYVTTCVSCDAPTALTKGSFNSSTHKQPINWTSAEGKVDICYSTSSTKPSSTPGSGYTVIEGLTGSTSTSNTYNLDVSGFAPGNYYVWARSICSESAKSDWVAMTSNYFTLTGYTLTLNKSGGGTSSTVTGDPTWTSVVPGNQVSVTATPASGYTFTSWSVSGTSSTLSSTSTNPTTFTMGTANSTVTATFSEIKVSSLTLHALKKDNTNASIFDETGDDVALAMYPQEGKTASPADPLGHTAKIEFGAVLPSDALDNTYTWSATVNGVATEFGGAAGNDLATNSVIEFNKNTGKLVAKAAGKAEIIITANDGSDVSAKVTITVANVAMSSVSVDPTSMSVYAGEKKPVAVTFTPANATDRSYNVGSYTYVNIQNKAAATFNIEGKTSVTDGNHNETVTVTTTDGAKTATVAVTVKPLPTVHFVDIIHNETFADVVSTVTDGVVSHSKTVPTHADISPAPASGNDCEKEHLHLIGWIRSDYSKVSEYMEGTGDAPTNAEITGAGAGYYYAAGAAITLTDDLHGKTFYAVWAKVE